MKTLGLTAVCVLLAGLIAKNGYAQAPTNLTVTKATNSEVDLSWNGLVSSYTLQRAVLGSSFSTIATATTTSAKDTTIDPYTTYQYQVLAAGTSTPSATVTVGPPPAGFQVAAPAPGVPGSQTVANYAWNISMTLDANGDPAFAFVYADPNLDSNPNDGQLLFRSWNRAKYAWNPVLKVTTAGDISSAYRSTISLAYDPSTATFGLASEANAASAVNLYVSTDGGLTWSSKASFHDAAGASYGPSLALAKGNVYLAFERDNSGIEYITGAMSAASPAWTTSLAPQPNQTSIALVAESPSLSLDTSGNAAIAYWVQDLTQGYNYFLMYWKPGSAPVKIMDSQNNASGHYTRMQFFGANPRIAVSVFRNDSNANGGTVHFVRSDDGGKTWTTPVLIPTDNHNSTDMPLGLALDSSGHGAMTFDRNSGSGDDACGFPKLARSTDLTNWTTCAAASVATTGNYNDIPFGLALLYGGNDKLYLAWQEGNTNGTGVGVLLWREPPATTGTAPSLRSTNPVQDAISARTQIVPGSWVSVYGANFSGVTQDWSNSDFSNGLPTTVAGVKVLVNGTPAPVWFVSPGQINFQAPSNIVGTAAVAVTNTGVSSGTASVNVVTSSPAVICYSADYVTFYPSAQFAGTFNIVGDPKVFGSSVQKALPGSQITFYATGLAATQSGVVIASPITFASQVKVNIGATSVTASYAGQIGAGYYQINFAVPAGLAAGNYTFTITANGQTSQSGVVLVVGP